MNEPRTDTLEAARHRLARLDTDIADLLRRRFALSGSLVESKLEQGRPLRDLPQEAARLRQLATVGGNPLDAPVGEVLEYLARVSVSQQAGYLAEHPSRRPGALKPVTISTGIKVGKGLCIFAGPCSVEESSSLERMAQAVKDAGADVLWGGCFEPRASPYDFQGLGRKGIPMLAQSARRVGLPCITEVIDPAQVAFAAEHADVLEIGARSMYSAPLLRAVARSDRPVFLKRGMAASLDEMVYAAEYIKAEGNERIILCERGIRTFEGAYRFTLDLAAVRILKAWTGLPVVVDVSHAAGQQQWVQPLAQAAVAVGADGILVETQEAPFNARSDGRQSLPMKQLSELVSRCRTIHKALHVPPGEF